MKKAGPILLVVLIALLGIKLLMPDVAADEQKEEIKRAVNYLGGDEAEQGMLLQWIDENHKAAAKAARAAGDLDAGDPDASRTYMKSQFHYLIDQATQASKPELAKKLETIGVQTLGPRDFKRPAE